MSFTALQWSKAIHVLGFTMWIGAMFALVQLLRAHAKAGPEARGALEPIEKITGIIMDVGATLTMVIGVYVLIRNNWATYLKGAGYMHVKLTLVAVFLGLHGFLRVKIRKFRDGAISPLPAWISPAIFVLLFVIAAMILARPM